MRATFYEPPGESSYPHSSQLILSIRQVFIVPLLFRFIWLNLIWYSRGKLIYTPNTPAFARVIKEVNQTFQDLKVVQNISVLWLNDISPAVHRFLDRLDPEIIDNITANIDQGPSSLNNISSSISNASEIIQR